MLTKLTDKLTELTSKLNSVLPSGIMATVSKGGIVTYSVRTMVAGKRVGLGSFTSYEKALEALISAKYKGYTVERIASVQEQLVREIEELEINVESSKDKLMAALSSLPPHLVASGLEIPEQLIRADAPTDAMIKVPNHIIQDWWALQTLQAKED